MKSQVSPFAALTGAEKQLKWLEYQSIRLPYTEAAVEKPETPVAPAPEAASETPKKPPVSDRAFPGETGGENFHPIWRLFGFSKDATPAI